MYHVHGHREEDAEVAQYHQSVAVQALGGGDTAAITRLRPFRDRDRDRGHWTGEMTPEEMAGVQEDPHPFLPTTREATNELMFSKVAVHAMIAG